MTVLLLALGAGVQAQEPYGDVPSPSSLERIRQGLHGAPLQIPPVPVAETTFHVDVDARWPGETPLDAVRQELAADARVRRRSVLAAGGATPLIQIDVLPAVYGLIHTVNRMRREHAVDAARRDVAADLARFCAWHDCSQAGQAPVEGVILP